MRVDIKRNGEIWRGRQGRDGERGELKGEFQENEGMEGCVD